MMEFELIAHPSETSFNGGFDKTGKLRRDKGAISSRWIRAARRMSANSKACFSRRTPSTSADTRPSSLAPSIRDSWNPTQRRRSKNFMRGAKGFPRFKLRYKAIQLTTVSPAGCGGGSEHTFAVDARLAKRPDAGSGDKQNPQASEGAPSTADTLRQTQTIRRIPVNPVGNLLPSRL